MRLYLSSYRLGDFPERLKSMVSGGKRVGVIFNALDLYPISEGIERCVEYFEEQGLPYRALRDGEVLILEPQSPAGRPPRGSQLFT